MHGFGRSTLRVVACVAVALAALSAPAVAAAQDPSHTTPPTLIVPADMSAWAQDVNGASVWYSIWAYDDSGAYVPVACTPAPGSLFPVGTTTVQCSATDTWGNTATDSFDVTVLGDETPPTLYLPGDMTLEPMTPDGASLWYYVWATDDRGSATVTCTPSAGTILQAGTTTTVECTATDAFGNTAKGSFEVTVLYPRIVNVTITGGTVDPVTGTATISGTVECTRGGVASPGFAYLYGDVQQRVGRTLITAGFGTMNTGSALDCSSPATPWSFTAQSTNGLFVAGSADVRAAGFGGAMFQQPAVEATVKLKPAR